MTTGTVLTLDAITPVDGPESALAARLCAAIDRQSPEPPLTIVAEGATALLLPAVALAQRSAHRRVAEYLLIEPDLPAVNDTWPDAPVTIVTADPDGWIATQARLRGWDLIDAADRDTWRPRSDHA